VKSAGSLLALLLFAAPLHASEHIEVRSAAVELRDQALAFTAQVHFPADEQTREALLAGATVELALQVAVEKKNQYWLDEQLLKDDFRRELTWNAPSQRFVLRDIESGGQQTFAALEDALAAAGRFEGREVGFTKQLDPEADYEAGVRGRLRRGRMPSALRDLTFWTRNWSRSEWYLWELPR
jgi:hypothetical protein